MIQGILDASWPAFLLLGGLAFFIILNIGLIFFDSRKDSGK